MSDQKMSNVRFVLHSGSLKMKFIILVTVIICTLTLLLLQRSVTSTRARLEDYRQRAIVLEHENSDLRNCIKNVNTAEGMEEIARNELGLVSPNTIVFTPVSGSN